MIFAQSEIPQNPEKGDIWVTRSGDAFEWRGKKNGWKWRGNIIKALKEAKQ